MTANVEAERKNDGPHRADVHQVGGITGHRQHLRRNRGYRADRGVRGENLQWADHEQPALSEDDWYQIRRDQCHPDGERERKHCQPLCDG